jgi:hypothetical protein
VTAVEIILVKERVRASRHALFFLVRIIYQDYSASILLYQIVGSRSVSFKGYNHVTRPSIDSEKAYLPFICGHCGAKSSAFVVALYDTEHNPIRWLLCTHCGDGSVMSRNGVVYPTATFGPEISGLPPTELTNAYNEARNCYSIKAYVACEQQCRGILMHVCVDKGAKDDQKFEFYVDYLEKNSYVTPHMKDWVDLIRQHGNKATHKLEMPDPQRAESTLMFTAELLRIVYEMPSMAKKYSKTP